MSLDTLKDPGTERSVLSTIIYKGRDGFIDADSILSSNDFSVPLNRIIYTSISELCKEDNIEKLDSEIIKAKSRALGFKDSFTSPKDIEYLEILCNTGGPNQNLNNLSYHVKRYSILRELHTRYRDATDLIEKSKASDSLSDILSKAEGYILDYVAGVDDKNNYENLSGDLLNKIQVLLNNKPKDIIGVSTGYPLWDNAIGGGLRKGTIAVIGARAKIGKSVCALNQCLNIAKQKIPVLYLDTELTKDYQQNRMICIESKCPISDFETGQFQLDSKMVKMVIDTGKYLQSLPVYYKSISGMTHTEAMSVTRRWLAKVVGFNEFGKANDCVIIYDYIKLMSQSQLSNITPEHIMLGLVLTELHNFCIKYEIPMIGFVQLNRDGINTEDTSVVAGSDRILWLSSSLTLLKNKTEEDVAMGCGYEFGNKKLVVLATRHGPGLEGDTDYINLHCGLRPNVSRTASNGYIKEGVTFSDAIKNRRFNIPQDSQPRSDITNSQ